MCRRRIRRLGLVVALLAAGHLLSGQTASEYDLVIRRGFVLDGAGNPWVLADVAIRGEAIADVGPGLPGKGRREIEARGLIVAPGFIDLHTHARRGIFQVPTAENYVRQGVTTIFEGPDGGSPLPIGAFLDRITALRTSVNWGMFVGQGSVREAVIGRVDRTATPAEIEQMKGLVRQGMRDGAFGISSGLFYVPGIFTPFAEVAEVSAAAGAMGGIYISHMRNEAGHILESVAETIAVGEQGRMPTQITHHKIIGTGNWGRSVKTLQMVDSARAHGVDVTIDQYPYTASATGINALLPSWALEGSDAQVVARLRDPAQRARIKTAIVESLQYDRGGGDPKNVAISSCRWNPGLAGKNLAQITRERGSEPTLEHAAETAMWIVEQGGASGIFHAISEDDLVRILQHRATMIASDGEVPIFGEASPHPRSYGTFARVLSRYVRDTHVLALPDAIRKMTSFPAWRVGLHDRGLIRPGMKADIVVFDDEKMQDMATFERPHQYAQGVHAVLVNGVVVFEEGRMTSARPGQVLRGRAYGPEARSK
jgi:N-acyl-D-amino-acid deacylase